MYITNGFYGLKKNIDKFIMINLIPNIVGMLLMSLELKGYVDEIRDFAIRERERLSF